MFFFALGVYRTLLWHMAGFYSYVIVFWPVGLDWELKALDFSKQLQWDFDLAVNGNFIHRQVAVYKQAGQQVPALQTGQSCTGFSKHKELRQGFWLERKENVFRCQLLRWGNETVFVVAVCLQIYKTFKSKRSYISCVLKTIYVWGSHFKIMCQV